MKTKARYLTTFFACMAMALAVFGGSVQGAEKKVEKRKMISTGDRAFAVAEVINVMSKHAYYHQVGQHCEELADLWVSETGPNSKTATWTSSSGVEEGMALIKRNYCTIHLESQKQTLAQLSKTNPEVKNVDANIGAGGEYVMHTQETPVIEIAGDGKTAKGLWYSIGLAVSGTVVNGKTTTKTGWMWEKYAVDFINEDGEWKIWHFINVMDENPVDSSSSQGPDASGPPSPGAGGQGAGGASAAGGQGGGAPAAGGQGGASVAAAGQAVQGRTDIDAKMEGSGSNRKVTRENSEWYKWSPIVAPKISPRFPERYYTFSETFSY